MKPDIKKDGRLIARTCNAIDSATPQRLREVLHAMCKNSRDGLQAVARELLISPEDARNLEDDLEYSSEAESVPGGENDTDPTDSQADSEEGGRKRKRPLFSNKQRYEICKRCKEEFDATDDLNDCVVHEGDLEIDDESSTWDDWDDNCHGERDTEENSREYPEGFIWSCCEARANAEGCDVGAHVPDTKKRVKTRTARDGRL